MTTELHELAKKPRAELAVPTLTPDDVRRALEVRAALAVQDDALVLQALQEGWLTGCSESIRVARTPESDSEDGSPVYVSVGSVDSPDSVMAGMVGASFVVRHTRVTAPVRNGQASLPSGTKATLPPPIDSPPKDTNEENNDE